MTTSIRWPGDRLLIDARTLRLPVGAVDYPESGSMVPRSVLGVQGWALFAKGPPDRVELSLDGRYVGRARLCCPREDIRQATGIEAGAVAGFTFDLELGEIPDGAERALIGAYAVGPEGERLELPSVEVWLAAAETAHAKPAYTRTNRQGRATRRPKDIELLVASGSNEQGRTAGALVELLGQVAAGYEVGGVVLSEADSPDLARLQDAGFEVHLTGALPVEDPAAYEDRLEELGAWAASRRFDAALIDGFSAFPGGDLALRLDLPAAWAIHETISVASHWETSDPEADPYVRRRAETALRSASAAVFEAEHTRRLFAAKLRGVPCVTVPQGVDIDALEYLQRAIDRDAARARRDIPNEAKVVLCMGTVSPPEEQATLVWAFARVADRHPGAVLVLVDELGPTDVATAGMAVSACGLGEDRVRIEPLFADLPEAYAMADVLVCTPGATWRPGSILEPMAVGLPVLGWSMLGIPELIEDGVTGWLAEPGDVGALALALDRVLSLDESECASVARAARARVRAAHDARACARAWAYVLTRVAAGRPLHLPLLASLTHSRSR